MIDDGHIATFNANITQAHLPIDRPGKRNCDVGSREGGLRPLPYGGITGGSRFQAVGAAPTEQHRKSTARPQRLGDGISFKIIADFQFIGKAEARAANDLRGLRRAQQLGALIYPFRQREAEEPMGPAVWQQMQPDVIWQFYPHLRLIGTEDAPPPFPISRAQPMAHDAFSPR